MQIIHEARIGVFPTVQPARLAVEAVLVLDAKAVRVDKLPDGIRLREGSKVGIGRGVTSVLLEQVGEEVGRLGRRWGWLGGAGP
jgi:hypothetical protein